MSCSCQSAAFRTAIRSISNLSVSDSRTASQRLPSTLLLAASSPLRPSPTPRTHAHTHTLTNTQRRGFHTSYSRAKPASPLPTSESIAEVPTPATAPELEVKVEQEEFEDPVEDGFEEGVSADDYLPEGISEAYLEQIQNIKKALKKSRKTERVSAKFRLSKEKRAEKRLVVERRQGKPGMPARPATKTPKKDAPKWKLEKPEKQAPRPKLSKDTPTWRVQKEALRAKFPEGWNPRKKLSSDAMDGIRVLHAQFPETYTTAILAQKFEVSPEAIRRILSSNWTRKEDGYEAAERWNQRGMRIWTQWATFGMNPPRKWEKQGIQRDMLQIGQRDGQEGNRRGTYMQKQFDKYGFHPSEEQKKPDNQWRQTQRPRLSKQQMQQMREDMAQKVPSIERRFSEGIM